MKLPFRARWAQSFGWGTGYGEDGRPYHVSGEITHGLSAALGRRVQLDLTADEALAISAGLRKYVEEHDPAAVEQFDARQ